MIADVTQNLAIRVVPVNRPSQKNQHGEQMGYYQAYVTHGTPTDEEWWQLSSAEREIFRGIVPIGIGYGSSGDPEVAIRLAITDYVEKFGALCQADTEAA